MSTNTITKCPNCDIPLENGKCPECGFKTTVLVTKIDTSGVKEEIKNELRKEENETKLLAFMDNLKSEFSSKYPAYADLFEAATSPVELHEILEQARAEKQPEKQRPPTGKAPFLPPSSGSANYVELLDGIYEKLQNPSKFTPEEVAEAEKQRTTLLKSMIEGPSWGELKASTKPVERHTFMTCPKCGATLQDTEKCDVCGEDWSRSATRNQKSARTWTYKHGKGEEIVPKW